MLPSCFLGTSILNAQPAEVWNELHPSWNATGSLHYNYRGFAYNKLNHHLYVAGSIGLDGGASTAANNHIIVLDASTGDSLTTLTLEPLALSGMGYGIRDVEVDDAGGIYAIQATQNRFHPLQLFYWANEDAEPVKLWQDPQRYSHSLDFAAGFSVEGDFNDEALIIIPFQNEDSIYYFEAVDGNLGSLGLMGLDVVGHGGTKAHVKALGTKITDGFWYNNSVLQEPTKFDGSGTVVAKIDASLFTGTTGGINQFTAGANTYLTVANAGIVQIIDITGKAADLSDVTAGDFTGIAGTASPPSSIHGYGQEEAVLANADGSYAIWSFSAYRYTKMLATEGAPIASGLGLIGSPLVDATKTAVYTYIDINGDAEGASEIKWYVADDDAGTNRAEITAAAGSATYTLAAGDVGKYITYTVLPVAATGTVSDPAHLVESAPFGPVLADVTPPVASNAAIAGVNKVGEVLTASYDFSDAGGELEGESIYKWFLSDDDMGTNATMFADGSLTYTVKGDDAGKFIMFVVIPKSATGWPLVGDADTAFTDAAILFPPFPPEASDVAISGRNAVEAVLTGSYTYSDLNEDEEEGSILKWYRAEKADTTGKVEVASDTNMYTLVAADEGKVILFEVTPVSVPTEGIDTGAAVLVATDTIDPRPPDYAPEARDVELLGTPEVSVLLSASYTYFDTILNDPEGASIYKWFTADDAAGTNATLIAGAEGLTYLVPEEQLGKHFIFEVTPVATSGVLLEGTPVKSNATATAAVASDNTFGLERMWLGSSKKGAVPEYLYEGDYLERGIAVGADKIYIASRNGGIRVMMIDKADGSYLGELNTEGISGGVYAINDVEVSDDGQILAAPLAIGTEFWIYKWADELSAPEKWIEVTLTESMRLGDKFSVTGDVSGDAIIMAAMSTGDKLVRWVVTGGIVGPAEYITLTGVTSIGNSPAAVPFTASADANILVDGKGFAPTIFDKDGNNLGGISGIEEYAKDKTQSNSPNAFLYKGRTMAAFYQHIRQDPFGVRVMVVDITAPPYQIIDSTEYLSDMGGTYDYLGEVDVTTDGDYYYTYQMQGKNALGAYRGELELPEFVEAQTTHDGSMIYTIIDKALMDITETDAAPWTVMADAAAVGIDSIRSSTDTIIFILTTAIAEDQVVTIAYDGLGTIASFNGMPLAAFGPESVMNITGADVPVATDVAVTGTLEPNEVLTGTYTFTDPDGDAEGTSTFQWWEATNADGSDKLKILGEKALTYTVGADMGNKYVAFEVTPVSAAGGEDYLVGEPVMSAFERIIVVGISDEFATGVRMYPNPVSNVLTIENVADVQSITLVDIAGRVMMTVENNGANEVILSMVDLRNGVYFVKLTGENNQLRIDKVLKTK